MASDIRGKEVQHGVVADQPGVVGKSGCCGSFLRFGTPGLGHAHPAVEPHVQVD
jgi:hypothetical protein